MPCGHRRPFWYSFVRTKEYIFGGDAFCKSHISLPNATTLCAGSFYFFTIFIRARFSSRMRSSTVFTAARISALGMRTASVAHG